MQELLRLQKVLEAEIAGQPGVQGVGIGLNAKRSDYAFKVLVDEGKETRGLPSKIEDVEVIFETTGAPKAF